MRIFHFVFTGEWEISAFDPNLKARGMSAQYSVFHCEKGLPLVDTEDDYDDFEDYFPLPMVRGARGGQGNRTVAIQVCRKSQGNDTQLENSLPMEGTESKRKMVCEVKYISVEDEADNDVLSNGGIPEDILEELDKELKGDLEKRQKRSLIVENTEGDTSAEEDLEVSGGALPDFPDHIDLVGLGEAQLTTVENTTEVDVDESSSEKNKTLNDFFGNILRRLVQHSLNDPIQTLNETWEEVNNSVENDSDRQNRSKLQRRQALDLIKHTEEDSLMDLHSGNDILREPALIEDNTLDSLNSLYFGDKDPDKLMVDLGVLEDLSNSTDNTTDTRQTFSFEYDDYSDEKNFSMNDIPHEELLNARAVKVNFRSYYIAAEEIMWDYGIKKPHQLIKPK